MAYTEFCCRSGGDNTNGGGLASGAEPPTTPVYASTNGNWTSGTGVFIPTDGSTPASAGIAAGDWASVFIDGATVGVFIARVVSVAGGVNGAITVSTTVKSGTAPTTLTTTRTIRIGGAWKGPNAAVGFPISVMDGGTQNTAADTVRINYKNDQTYDLTAQALSPSLNGAILHRGYTTTFGDGGKATVRDVLAGASYNLFNLQLNYTNGVEDFIFDGNGASGTGALLFMTRQGIVRRCIFKNSRGAGLHVQFASSPTLAIECEAYGCCLSGGAGQAVFNAVTTLICIRCIAHNNTTSNTNGFGGMITCIECVSASNGSNGFQHSASGNAGAFLNCDAYNNGVDGWQINNVTCTFIENCNSVKNVGWGVGRFSATTADIKIINHGFGNGSQANSLGTIKTPQASSSDQVAPFTYPPGDVPWVDPTIGDFRINHLDSIGMGRGTFVETVGSAGWSAGGTIGYPDVGAARRTTVYVPPTPPTLPAPGNLITLAAPIYWPGHTATATNPAPSNALTMTAIGHYLAYVFVAKEDMNISHVSVRWSAVTGTTVTADYRIETPDPTTGLPSGNLWNSAGANNTVGSTGTLVANTTLVVALGGTAVITKGQAFCLKILMTGGTSISANTINMTGSGFPTSSNLPYQINNTGAPTRTNLIASPAVAFGNSATTFYYTMRCVGGYNANGGGGFSNSVAGARRGLRFIPPFNCRAIGGQWHIGNAVGNYNLLLLNDAGTTTLASSGTMDGPVQAGGTNNPTMAMFTTSYLLTAETVYRLILEPTTTTNTNITTVTMSSNIYRSAWLFGTRLWYATYTTAAGSWTDTDTAVPIMDIILDQVPDGVVGGGPVGELKSFGRGAPY